MFSLRGCSGSFISSCEVRHWSPEQSQGSAVTQLSTGTPCGLASGKFISVGDLYSTWYFGGHRIKGSSRVNVTGLRGILTA